MAENYTRNISDFILDLPDQEIAVIWEDIQAMPLDTTETLWRKKLTKIARENTFSSRFALMRILCARAQGRPISHPGETELPASDGFSFSTEEKTFRFSDISMTHAETLTPREHLDYFACLMDIASRQADSDPETDANILSRGWYDVESANAVAESLLPEAVAADPKQRKTALSAISRKNKAFYKEPLTREEALILGHMLDFSPQEMQWFLLRVFDVAEGFRFNYARDLVEAYGFLTHASWQHVRRLQTLYEEKSATIPKQELPQRNDRWTKNLADTLPGKVELWSRYPETQDDAFLDWMLTKAPGLDVPSRRAGQIYRNLCAFAWDLLTGAQLVPQGADFVDCLRDVYQEEGESEPARQLLRENGTLSPVCCKRTADALLLENKIQCASVHADNTKAWHILTRRKDGSPSGSYGIVNSSRSRVADILMGTVQAEKGDMLYLLWFLSNHIWMQEPPATDNVRCCRLMDFLEVSRELLEEAGLPTFYPPHIMERSMLLSIACGGKSEEDDPSVVYEYMLHATLDPRNSKKKA